MNSNKTRETTTFIPFRLDFRHINHAREVSSRRSRAERVVATTHISSRWMECAPRVSQRKEVLKRKAQPVHCSRGLLVGGNSAINSVNGVRTSPHSSRAFRSLTAWRLAICCKVFQAFQPQISVQVIVPPHRTALMLETNHLSTNAGIRAHDR